LPIGVLSQIYCGVYVELYHAPGESRKPSREVRKVTRPRTPPSSTCARVRPPLRTPVCPRSRNVPGRRRNWAVHIGARVAALAGPGEVLVSRTVKDLVAGSGLVFVDRGMHPLKGVPDEWQLYALAG